LFCLRDDREFVNIQPPVQCRVRYRPPVCPRFAPLHSSRESHRNAAAGLQMPIKTNGASGQIVAASLVRSDCGAEIRGRKWSETRSKA
jgi:hypothetical protein